MAEGIAKAMELPGYGFLSAGTAPVIGLPATAEAVLVAAEVGADLDGHLARDLSSLERIPPDEVLVMEPHHATAVLRSLPELAGNVHLLDPAGAAIADPYGRSVADYRETRDRIVAALEFHARRWRI